MKKLVLLLAAISLAACSNDVEHSSAPAGGSPINGAAVSCNNAATQNGGIISCSNGQTVTLINGAAYHVGASFDVCGADPGFNETILKLSNGQFARHYQSASQYYLALQSPGSYTTSDGSGCVYTIDASGVVVDHDGNVFR